MNSLIRYRDPFESMVRTMQKLMDRDDTFFSDDFFFRGDSLAIDVSTNDHEIIVKTAVPGVKEEDIKLDVQGNILTISGETRNEHEDKQQNWHIREMRYGKFSRSVRLPDEVKSDKAEATLDNGILTVTLPKAQPNPVQKIVVKARNMLTGEKK